MCIIHYIMSKTVSITFSADWIKKVAKLFGGLNVWWLVLYIATLAATLLHYRSQLKAHAHMKYVCSTINLSSTLKNMTHPVNYLLVITFVMTSIALVTLYFWTVGRVEIAIPRIRRLLAFGATVLIVFVAFRLKVSC